MFVFVLYDTVMISNRFLFAMYALYEGIVFSENDVLYSALPMYHTAGGLMVTGIYHSNYNYQTKIS